MTLGKLPSFKELALAQTSTPNSNKEGPFTGSLLCLDPGETTGFARFTNQELTDHGELPTPELNQDVEKLLDYHITRAGWVVMEDYRIYSWKTESHAWSQVHTLRLIGMIITLCIQHNVPYVLQSAQQAKGFATDDRLKEWSLYQRGSRHARDAIRHGVVWQLFNYPKAGEGRSKW